MATRKHTKRSHKRSHSAKKMTHKSSNNTGKVNCFMCKKMVALKESKVISFKVNGHTRKRLAGVGVCGHKVSKFLKSDA